MFDQCVEHGQCIWPIRVLKVYTANQHIVETTTPSNATPRRGCSAKTTRNRCRVRRPAYTRSDSWHVQTLRDRPKPGTQLTRTQSTPYYVTAALDHDGNASEQRSKQGCM